LGYNVIDNRIVGFRTLVPWAGYCEQQHEVRWEISMGKLISKMVLVVGIVTLVSLAGCDLVAPPGGFWVTRASMPTARWAATAVANGIIYAISGVYGPYPPNYVTTVEAYNPATDTWSTRAPIPAACLGSASTVNGVIYVIGGATDGGYTNAVQAYDPVGDAWTTRATMPTTRQALTIAVNDLIYAIGGGNGAVRLDTVEVYNPSIDIWTTKTSMPAPSEVFGIASGNGVIYVIGGAADTGLENYASSVYAYNIASDSWSTRTSMPTARYTAIAVINGVFYAIGGQNANGVLSMTEAYNPAKDTWSAKPSMPTARLLSLGQLPTIQGIAYAIGGYATSSTAVGTVEAFAP
jgi:N-acetylneuraminic acid mutarotase